MRAFLGIDVGTSATKALLLSADGRVLATASAPHPISHPHPGWSEQDPLDWWRSTIDAIRALLAHPGVSSDQISAVGMSGQMHGSVFLGTQPGSAGNSLTPLRPALLWNDQRTARECEEIEAAIGGRAALVSIVGNAALTGFTAPKVLWLRRHEPELFEQTSVLCMPKDYIRYRLTGSVATDVGDASGTLLFDVHRREWSRQVCAALGLNTSLLPPVLESSAVAGHITAEAAPQTGLRAGTPVIAGSGDNMTGAVGSGVVEPGIVAATLGTSGVIIAPANQPVSDTGGPDGPAGRTHTMCSAAGLDPQPGGGALWCITGCTLAAGGSLKWLRDSLFPSVSYEQLDREASDIPPGASGLIFLPYLTGERCPYPDPGARGAFIGLTSRHTRAHLVRAVLEGVCFGMGQILDLIRALGVPASSLRLSGGGASSQLWRTITADVLRTPVILTNSTEGPALGAAILAGVGAGTWPGVAAACRELITQVSVTEPCVEQCDRYTEPMTIYRSLYPRLAETSHALGRIEAGS